MGPAPAGRALLVDAPEGEARDVDVERPEPLLEVPAGDLAVDGLGGHVLDGDGGFGPLAHAGETSVGVVEVRLLLGQVGMRHRCLAFGVDARERAAGP